MDHCATDTARPAATASTDPGSIPQDAHKATFTDPQGWDLYAQDDGSVFLLHQIPTDDNPERRLHLIAVTDAQAVDLIAFMSSRLALTGAPRPAAPAPLAFAPSQVDTAALLANLDAGERVPLADPDGEDLTVQEEGGVFMLRQVPEDDDPNPGPQLVTVTVTQAAALMACFSARLAPPVSGSVAAVDHRSSAFVSAVAVETLTGARDGAAGADTAAAYADRVTLFSGDAPVVTLTKASAVGLAREILRVHGAGEVA